MSDWKPIKTAPKDGNTVLILFPGGQVTSGYWLESDVYGSVWAVVSLPSHGCGCCETENPYPTHWMPLPLPPEEKD